MWGLLVELAYHGVGIWRACFPPGRDWPKQATSLYLSILSNQLTKYLPKFVAPAAI